VSKYRRYYLPGGSYFFTIVTHGRHPWFANPAHVTLLRSALRQVKLRWPFEFVAGVILPEHLHFIWTLPIGDTFYSRRISRMKALFSQSLPSSTAAAVGSSRFKHRERAVWQRRFWEHTLRDEDDLKRHLDYLHYNPVKHGLASCPHSWPHSSFRHWVERGEYDATWGCRCGGRPSLSLDFADVADTAGE
jgi:REP-associated tyrosine transposase